MSVLVWKRGERSGKVNFSVTGRCDVSCFPVFGGRLKFDFCVCGGFLIDAGVFVQVVAGLMPLMRSRLWCAASVGT